MKPTPITPITPIAPITPTDASSSTAVPATSEAPSPFVKAKFDALLLVCGRCAARSSGPSKGKAKKLPGEFKKALGHERPRFRIVESSCLGLCPKKATAVVAAVGDAPLRLAAVRDKDDVQAMAKQLRARR